MRGRRRHDLVAVEDALEKVTQPIGILWSHHQIYLGHTSKELLALLLRDTTRDDNGHVLSVALADRGRPQVRVQLLLGMLADRARVDHHHVRVRRVGRLGEA